MYQDIFSLFKAKHNKNGRKSIKSPMNQQEYQIKVQGYRHRYKFDCNRMSL